MQESVGRLHILPGVHQQNAHENSWESVAELKLMPKARVCPRIVPGLIMKDHTYKLIELVGTSGTGIEDAVNNAVQRAGQTIKNMRWFQVMETRGQIENNKVAHWQVTLKIGFTIEDPT